MATGPMATGPVVVELFTSQACPYCPEADAFLQELSALEDVIALSFPIDYWNFYGWSDTLAQPEHGDRQKAYRNRLSNRRLYTPQIVVQGAAEAHGGEKDNVRSAIQAARGAGSSHIQLERRGEELVISLPAATIEDDATLWLAPFSAGPVEVSIEGGENAGKTLHYTHVVKGLTEIGPWKGEPATMTLDCSAASALCADANAGSARGFAIIAQDGPGGAIIAAGSTR
ncbi:MAG: DUF1223 domain-containing protein [Pseudomonadota bacterium]